MEPGILVKNLQQQFPGKLFIMERNGKQGLGRAYIAGFHWAIDKKYDYIFEMDADFSHNPDDLIRLRNACANEGADVAVGSRYVKGGGVVNWPLNRVLLSKYASVYVQMITGMKIKDATAGFKCYKRKVLETIDLDKIHFVGYAFQIEIEIHCVETWL
jgi:dolichol-phosphate mannosyltransferase